MADFCPPLRLPMKRRLPRLSLCAQTCLILSEKSRNKIGNHIRVYRLVIIKCPFTNCHYILAINKNPLSDVRKHPAISTPFHRNDKENRISMGSGISDIRGAMQNQTENSEDSWADLSVRSRSRKSK